MRKMHALLELIPIAEQVQVTELKDADGGGMGVIALQWCHSLPTQ
jgi:hypothetical protein